MGIVFKWLLRVFAGLLVLLALGVTLSYYLAGRSVPDYAQDQRVTGLYADVEIIRDRHAVPHIFAQTEEDAFFAQGYVHAQDRLWQMTFARRAAQGRLSEIIGAETFEIDETMRALNLQGVAQQMLPHQSERTRKALESYAKGVNARIRHVQEQARGRGGPEFFLFGAQIAAWTPVDSLSINRLLALQLTDHAKRESLRAELSLILQPDRVADLMPEAPLIAVDQLSGLWPNTRDARAQVFAAQAAKEPGPQLLNDIGFAGASNAFAASGSRTATGTPLLAADPHLGLSAPGIWYLNRIQFPDGGVIGGSIPGLPGMVIGRNDHFGWGITASYVDDQDVIIERITQDDPNTYITPEGKAAFTKTDVLIPVAGEPARKSTILRTHHGPVLPHNQFGTAPITPPGHVAVLRWTGFDPTDRSMDAWLSLMRMRSVAELRPQIEGAITPAVNLIVADEVDVGHILMGRAPARGPMNAAQGRLPSPGWIAGNDWDGYRPHENNPADFDPASGLIINTNNRITDAPYPDHLSFDWSDSQRILRARKLLAQRQFHSVESFRDAQLDTVSEAARGVLALIGQDLWYTESAAISDAPSVLRRAALDRLAAWNGDMSEHLPEPLIYTTWVRELQQALIQDELGPLAASFTAPDPLFLERVFRNTDGAGAWCNIRQTSVTETCAMMAKRALDNALAGLSSRYGNRIESWRWGEAHIAQHHHKVLGNFPLLNVLSNINQPTSGGDFTLNRGKMRHSGPTPYANVHAAGLRVIYDFQDPEGSFYIAATGQSGHFLSKHYDDLSVLWRRGEYIPMSLSEERARNGALGAMWLKNRAE